MTPTSIGVRPHAITAIFRRVLESDDVTVDSDFFEVGGDSLLATRVLSAIARFGPAPASLASWISQARCSVHRRWKASGRVRPTTSSPWLRRIRYDLSPSERTRRGRSSRPGAR